LGEKFVSIRNLKFLLYEVFGVETLTQHAYYRQYDRRTFDMVLSAAMDLAEGLLRPHFQEMDRNPPELMGDAVRVHPSVRAAMEEFGKGGWIAATVPEELGGEQLPYLIADSCQYIFAAANYSTSVYGLLCTGAAHLIESFGSKELFNQFVPKMYAGEWQGTMALTEAEAGSSLSDIATTAVSADGDYYKIQGQKVFISAGDHDAVENVVHLMLAKIPGGPPGVKGISLFVVPQKRIAEDGRLVSNDVITAGIFHKLGYRGCPIVHLSIGDHDDCRGYLVGEPHKGLNYMFQMMNETRIAVGMGAAAVATAAFYASLDYAKQRKQGRRPSEKDPTRPQIPIIEHADVKRMLLFQRAVVEGSLALVMQCSKYVDLQKTCGTEEKERYGLLLEILTPVAKTYPSEMGILSISQGLQCFGGSGYCDDYPLEQYYRDARIHPIHEGTTGIHGMDLLGRKVVMLKGKAFAFYQQEVRSTIEQAKKQVALAPYERQLSQALEKLTGVTSRLLGIAEEQGAAVFLADATLYLEFFGIVSIAWQWLLQAIAIHNALEKKLLEAENNFYQGKLYTFRYFFSYELPKIEGLVERLMNSDGLTVTMRDEWFSD